MPSHILQYALDWMTEYSPRAEYMPASIGTPYCFWWVQQHFAGLVNFLLFLDIQGEPSRLETPLQELT